MRNISFRVAHQCPQCGAPIVLDEETLFFACEYCRVKSVICQQGFPRYLITRPEKALIHPDAPDDKDLIYLPYWRFKGVRFACTHKGVEHRFMDLSALALEGYPASVPFSLGFRSQALTLKRVSSESHGRFIRPVEFKAAVTQAEERSAAIRKPGAAVFSEDIGETLSLIFAPFYIKRDTLVDAILNTPTQATISDGFNPSALDSCRPEKETTFVSGLCPDCGWDLEGGNDSLVLVCRNCNTLWKARNHVLARIRFAGAAPAHETDVMVPFWKIRARVSDLPASSYADLVRLANLPKAVQPEWEDKDLFFWAPAFKIRPQIFQRLASQLLIAQPDPDLGKTITKQDYIPVNLPASEAAQTIKIIIASLMRPLKDHLPKLPGVRVQPQQVTLVFLPFEERHHDYFHPGINVAVNKNILHLSGNL